MRYRLDRRGFLQVSAAVGAGAFLGRSARAFDVNGKLRLAAIGTGGKGRGDLASISASPRVEVVALCDVDESKPHLGWAAERFARAERFRDYRKLLDQANLFDAVCVATPDHMHAPIALAAMALGKHVYCEKPLAHTVHESRRMSEAAARHKLVTQMGNQIQSHHFYRTAAQVVREGGIGKVREVHSWQSTNMGWLLSPDRPKGADPVPKTLEWDLWLGVAPERPYKRDVYHPFNWRAWQDFSTGQLGDFGCHILDPVFKSLGLTAPISVEAAAPALNQETWALRSKVEYRFPGTPQTVGETIGVTWYDGPGNKPEGEKLGLPSTYQLPTAGSVFVGEKGAMVLPHYAALQLFPEEQYRDFKIPKLEDLDHYTAWAHACLGDGETGSNFSYAGPLTETVLLGAIAIRFPGEQLVWDAKRAEIVHHEGANGRLTKAYRRGWELPTA